MFLYSHWDGYELPETLRSALVRGRGRWSDESYLARIVFCEMVAGDQQGDTGYGISTRLTDNGYDLLVFKNARVYVVPESDYVERGLVDLPRFPSISFEEYVAAPSRSWDDLGAEVAA